MKLYAFLFVFLFASFAQAQTITPNESTIVLQSPKKIGINLNGPTYYQGGEIYKNLLWRNPGFEPDIYRDKFVAFKSGTATSFPSPNFYDPVLANFWTGATFRLYRGTNPRNVVCTGTLAGNTTASGSNGPVYQFASPCSTPVQEGDVIIIRHAIACTQEAVWENAGGGWWGSVASGGKLTSECAAPYDGTQSLRMDASAAGSSAAVRGYVDSNPTDVGILFNGQYTISGFYKTIGSARLAVSAQRLTTSAAGNPFACSTQTFSPSPIWTAFTATCSGSETSKVTAQPVQVTLAAQGGAVEIDNVAFQKIDTDPSNTTVFRDELIATLKQHCAGASLSAVPCELRDWAFQNADEISNTIKPLFERSPTLPSTNYDIPSNGGVGSNSVGLEEFLELCQAIDAEPYYVLPETTGPEDGGKWIEYLNGSPLTVYGAIRAAHGHTASWLSIFPTIHLPMGNENWNEGGGGQGLGYRADAPDFYYDYSVDAAGVWNQMRSSASWPVGGAGIDLVLNFQDGNANYGVTEAWNRAQPNSGEVAPYTQAYVGDVAPLTSLWNPLFFEVANNTTNPALVFFQQGSAIKAHGKLNVYEYDNGTGGGGAGLSQSVLDSFTDAAGYGTATALQSLQHLAFGIVDQNFFSLDQYAFYIPNVGWIHNWGAVIDMGGATNAVRPQELGMRMANAAIIGPMYSCPVANPTTYDLGANHNGADSTGMPATKNVPQQYAYCFKAGDQRSMIVINTDVTDSHAISFTGTQAPAGTVTLTRYAPASISATNEGTANGPTMNAPQNVSIDDPITVAKLTSDTLPPYSITRYDWSTDGISSAPGTPVSTTTTLASSANLVSIGTSIVLTAHVSPSAVGGSIVFKDGGVSIGNVALVNGAAQITIPSPLLVTHLFSAAFAGSSSYAPSTSGQLTVTVGAPTKSGITVTGTRLSVSSTSPRIGYPLTIEVAMNNPAIIGTITLYDGTTAIVSGHLVSAKMLYTVRSITPGTHTYVAQYHGTTVFAPSTSPMVSVHPSTVSTTTRLSASSSIPDAGSSLVLTVAVSPSAATGAVVYKDGDATIGIVSLVSGSAAYTIPSISSGSHSFTASYQGDATYSPSQSAALSLSTVQNGPFFSTAFNEYTAGTPLNGTHPGIDNVGAVWSDPNGDWTYNAGGGIITDTADLVNPVLIDAANSNYTATFDLPSGYGVHLLFRYTDLQNMLFIVTYQHEVDLYSIASGQSQTLATVYPSSTNGTVSLTLAGSIATLQCGGKTATGTIPDTVVPSTRLGFQPNAYHFVIRSLSVTP